MKIFDIKIKYYEKEKFGVICRVDRIVEEMRDKKFIIVDEKVSREHHIKGYPFVVYYEDEFHKMILIPFDEEVFKKLKKYPYALNENKKIYFYKENEKIEIGILNEKNLKKIAFLFFNKDILAVFFLQYDINSSGMSKWGFSNRYLVNFSWCDYAEMCGSISAENAIKYIKQLNLKEVLEFLKNMKKELRYNHFFFIELLKLWPLEDIFELIDEKLKNDYLFAMEVAKINGMFLKLMHKSKKRNKNVVLSAVSNNGLVLEFSHKHQKDKEVVLEAVRNNGFALKFADEELKDDEEVVLEAVRNNGLVLEFASDRLKNDEDIAFESIKTTPEAIQFVSKKFRKDKEFIKIVDEYFKSIFDEEKAKEEISKYIDEGGGIQYNAK